MFYSVTKDIMDLFLTVVCELEERDHLQIVKPCNTFLKFTLGKEYKRLGGITMNPQIAGGDEEGISSVTLVKAIYAPIQTTSSKKDLACFSNTMSGYCDGCICCHTPQRNDGNKFMFILFKFMVI